MDSFLTTTSLSADLQQIADKVFSNQRITPQEGVMLFEKGELGFLGMLADHVRQRLNGDKVYYNRNVHIEPTNICVNNCRFCSYSHHFSKIQWELTVDEMVETVKSLSSEITEVHIVGAVHPDRDIYYYADLLKRVREAKPEVHIKAFTAVEIQYMVEKAKMTLEEGLKFLQQNGLDSLPGGGAEIFDPTVRTEICGKKSSSGKWLEIHRTAHQLGIPTNATILYGHIETFGHRIDHLNRLRLLQDETQGFNAFIPLKFRNQNHTMSHIREVSLIDDLKNYAVTRIFLDNIPHLKAYWPMIGKQMAALALAFGVDDLDGTINDSTKIYSLAGSDEQSPSMSTDEICSIIRQADRTPVERDSLYHPIEKVIL